MEANRDFVASDVDVELRWTLHVPATTESVSGQCSELLSLVEQVLDCCPPFVLFQRCNVTLDICENNITYKDRKSDTLKSTKSLVVESDDAFVRAEEIERAVIDEAESGTVVLSHVEFTLSRVFVTLDGFEGYVQSGDEYRYKTIKHGTVRGPASTDLLRLRIIDGSADPYDMVAPMRYEFQLITPSELWIKDTHIGEQNRQRLKKLVSCLDETLPNGPRQYWGEPYGVQTPDENPNLGELIPWRGSNDIDWE
jgi:hypothetical protein